ncbi:MAG: 1-deoxy-D-xylulose-5-phosphate synthase [Ruminococcus sp.]|jgi:1-deoxy-D-xylulose-5-phosphate synthase|nr:1-deoxy-D-xylulose-5-phosphate synthase [Ruminococcus sp.]
MKKIDVKKLSVGQCKLLCRNLRREIIKETLKNGGHLASSLGTVELTVALHRVFDFPGDKLVWDVGHQAYAHKLLTGRSLEKLRKSDGVSGFPRITEGDDFIGGHSGIAISAALGFAEAIKLDRSNASAVAVVGDGAMTSGECFEGLNNAGKSGTPLIIILNQNDMSISKSVGALSDYLSSIRTDNLYKQVKKGIYDAAHKMPFVAPFGKTFTKAREALKRFIYEPAITLFEQFGFLYIGPIDGHNSADLEEALREAKSLRRPVVVHVNTIKGKGFEPAQKNPGAFHSFPEGHSAENPPEVSADCFSCVFGNELVHLARADERICAITPAMKYASGLNTFSEVFPDRFFDVGIAEEHAVTFAAGLAAAGKLPVAAIYSSFLQRAYDQILHDLAASNLHAVLCVDRAGFVGEDGETHQGIYDVSMLCGIPNVTIYSPSDYDELRLCLKKALYETEGVAAVRYPRGAETLNSEVPSNTEYADFTADFSGKKLLCIGYGRQFNEIKKAQNEAIIRQESELLFDTLKLLKIHPFFIPKEVLKYREIIFFEEGIKTGGAGEQFAAKLLTLGFKGKFRLVAADGFIKQDTVGSQISQFSLDCQGVFDAARSVFIKERKS